MGDPQGHGLAIFGRRLGRYPIDPTLVIQTAQDLAQPVGWVSNEPVTVDRMLDRARLVEGIATGQDGGHTWRYTTEKPPGDWTEAGLDDSSWQTGKSGFGSKATPSIRVHTPWTTADIWLRTQLDLPVRPLGILLRYFHDEDMEIYVNGKRLLEATGYVRDYRRRPLGKAEMDLFQQGRNTIAVHCRQTLGGQGIDLGISWIVLD